MNKDKGILLLLGSAHSLNHSLFLVLPPLLGKVSRDLNVSFQTLGIVVTISFLIYGVGALVGGPLSDYLGEVKIARISTALSGASTFIFILSKDLHTFGVGMFLMALWASFYHPTSNNLISKLFVTNTAGAMGIHGAAGSVGQMFTPTIAYLLGTLIDWRFAFTLFGVLSILTALVMGKIPASKGTTVREKVSLLEIFKVPSLWILILYNIIGGLFFRGVELFFPTFLSENKGFSGQLAAISYSLVLFFGVIGQLLGGRAADRYGSSKVIIVSSLGVVASMLFLLLLPLNIIGVIFFIIIYGLAFFGHQPAMTSLVGVVSPKNLKGMAYGVMFFFAFGLGSVSTTIAGYLADVFNLEVAFWSMALFSTMALIVSLAIPKMLRRQTVTFSKEDI